MVLLKNKLKKFFYTKTLQSLKSVSPVSIQKESEKKAVQAFISTQNRFPQYRAFLNKTNNASSSDVSNIDSFKRHVPLLDKETIYNSAIASDMRFSDQDHFSRILLSSGSSGNFSFGLSYPPQIKNDGEFLNILLATHLDILNKKTLIINCLTVVHLPDLDAVICEIGPRTDSLLYLLKTVAPQFEQTIIMGDNYFIKNALEDGLMVGLNYRALHIHLILGGVYLPESLRTYLKTLLNNTQPQSYEIISSMGISEFGLNLFIETEETIRLRQCIENDPLVKEKILDKSAPDYTPMVFNYFPQMFYIEEVKNELVVTSFNASSFLPLVRYNTRDRFNMISYQELEKLIESEPKLTGLLPPFKSPLILMYGKNEYCEFDSVKIYPPQIQKGLYENFSVASKITGYFRINKDQKDLEVQLKKGIELSEDLKNQIQNAANKYLSIGLPVNLYSYTHFPYGMELDYQRKFKYL